MKQDKLNEPIEFICATYSFNGLRKLLRRLDNPYNIASVCDELTMRVSSEIEQNEHIT